MKKILVVLTIILVMILSTGCQAEPNKPDATLPDIGVPIPEATLPDIGVPEPRESEMAAETTEVETTEEPTTTVEPTTEEETTTIEETIEKTKPEFTFKDYEGFVMYVKASVNIRTLPSTKGEIVTTRSLNEEVWVTGQCVETGWYRIMIEGQTYYVSNNYVSKEKVVVNRSSGESAAIKPASGFVYYSVAGQYPNKEYEQYLYNCLVERGIAWWYPYAVAQIWQESRWNPKSTNGKDHGICQFKGIYFQGRAEHYAGMKNADIWNPYDSLKVYSYYIKAILAACGNKVDATLSFYIVGGTYYWNQDYINHVMNWYNQLRAQ